MEKWYVSVPKVEYLVMRVWVFVSLRVCTGNLSLLVVPCVASTMMSIQKLSLSRWGECSTACFLNLWISCRFCTTDRKYLEGNIQKQSHLLYEYENNWPGITNTLDFLSLLGLIWIFVWSLLPKLIILKDYLKTERFFQTINSSNSSVNTLKLTLLKHIWTFMMCTSLPKRWLEFEELLGSLSSFGDVVSEHANGEELAHVPVVIHFLQGTFASQQTVQPHTYNTRL